MEATSNPGILTGKTGTRTSQGWCVKRLRILLSNTSVKLDSFHIYIFPFYHKKLHQAEYSSSAPDSAPF